uniref:MULE transposase domain-containing protein n=1 Tax=Ditylenchus dipsaci TaxID=166011 RepID=A0A915CVF7_9BILA
MIEAEEDMRRTLAGVYAILAEKNAVNPAGGKYVFPILYALIENKNNATYEKLFGMVKALMPGFNPTSINVDFEQSAIRALRDAYPDAPNSEDSKIAGCSFHLLKNFKKQFGNAGLMQKYRDPTTDFALTSRMLMSLAFVPLINIYECFRELKSYLLREEPSLEPVIMWFSSYYVGTLMRPPPFPVHLWSCYNRTLAGQDRTNNFAEAAHRRLHTILGIDHPTMVISWAR